MEMQNSRKREGKYIFGPRVDWMCEQVWKMVGKLNKLLGQINNNKEDVTMTGDHFETLKDWLTTDGVRRTAEMRMKADGTGCELSVEAWVYDYNLMIGTIVTGDDLEKLEEPEQITKLIKEAQEERERQKYEELKQKFEGEQKGVK